MTFFLDFRHEKSGIGVDFQTNQPEASQLWVTVDRIGSKISLRNKGKDAWWLNSVKSFPFFATKSGHGQIMENDSVKDEPESKPGMFQRNQVQYSGLTKGWMRNPDSCARNKSILFMGSVTPTICGWVIPAESFWVNDDVSDHVGKFSSKPNKNW